MKNRILGLALAFLLCASSAFAIAVPIDALWVGLRDANNQPLEGGKVFTYEAGTSFAKATYLLADQTQLAANPIILDAYGKASIYASGRYKFIIKDQYDVILRIIDNLEYTSPTNLTDQVLDSLTVASGTISEFRSTDFTLSDGLISSATVNQSYLSAVDIHVASITDSVLYNASSSAPTIDSATLTYPVIYNASMSQGTWEDVTLTRPLIASAVFTDGSSCPPPASPTEIVNKNYVDVTWAALNQASRTTEIDTAVASLTASVTALVDLLEIVEPPVHSEYPTTATGWLSYIALDANGNSFAQGTDIESFGILNDTSATATYLFYVSWYLTTDTVASGPLWATVWLHDGTKVFQEENIFKVAATFTYGASPLLAEPSQSGFFMGITDIASDSVKDIYLRVGAVEFPPLAGNKVVLKLGKNNSWYKYYRIR